MSDWAGVLEVWSWAYYTAEANRPTKMQMQTAISRLRSGTPLPRPISRTKKFESFVNFDLNKYQSPL